MFLITFCVEFLLFVFTILKNKVIDILWKG